MKLTVAKKMQGEEEITMDILEDEIVNEESLDDKIVDRLDQKKKTDALFLLQTKVTDNIMDGVTSLVKNTVEILKMGVQNRLDSAGLRFDAVPGLDELFKDDHPISSPLCHVNTEHKQAAYFKENFNLVVGNQ